MSNAHKLHLTFYDAIDEQRKAWERLRTIDKNGRGSVSRFIAKAINAYPHDDEEKNPDCRNESADAIIGRMSQIADRMENMLTACENGRTVNPTDETKSRKTTPENNLPDENDVDMDFLGDFME